MLNKLLMLLLLVIFSTNAFTSRASEKIPDLREETANRISRPQTQPMSEKRDVSQEIECDIPLTRELWKNLTVDATRKIADDPILLNESLKLGWGCGCAAGLLSYCCGMNTYCIACTGCTACCMCASCSQFCFIITGATMGACVAMVSSPITLSADLANTVMRRNEQRREKDS